MRNSSEQRFLSITATKVVKLARPWNLIRPGYIQGQLEMILLNLKRRLQDQGLSHEEREHILMQIKKIEGKMGLE